MPTKILIRDKSKLSRLQLLREKAGLTKQALADKVGLSVSSICCYEEGTKDIKNARAINVYRLCEALNCSVEELLEVQSQNMSNDNS